MSDREYDPRVCFDDLLSDGACYDVLGSGGDFYGIVTGAAPAPRSRDAGSAILRRAHRRRTPARTRVIGANRRRGAIEVLGAAYTVAGGGGDPTYRSFDFGPGKYALIGDDDAPVELPIYGAYYRQFADDLPQPKLARVDDVDSYADFRAARRQPYVDQLAARLDALEAAVADHVSDHHGGGRVDALEAALRAHLAECTRGGSSIDLPIPACSSGQLDCWQDGPEILCTVIVLDGGGQPRMVTSGTPVAEHAAEVAECARDEGLDADETASAGPAAVQVVGACAVAEQVLGCAGELVQCCGVGGLAVLAPAVDPSVAAAMSLLQDSQRGSWAAAAEVIKMSKSNVDLLNDAARRLIVAQRMAGGGSQ